jgi:hypothetical protein
MNEARVTPTANRLIMFRRTVAADFSEAEAKLRYAVTRMRRCKARLQAVDDILTSVGIPIDPPKPVRKYCSRLTAKSSRD